MIRSFGAKKAFLKRKQLIEQTPWKIKPSRSYSRLLIARNRFYQLSLLGCSLLYLNTCLLGPVLQVFKVHLRDRGRQLVDHLLNFCLNTNPWVAVIVTVNVAVVNLDFD